MVQPVIVARISIHRISSIHFQTFRTCLRIYKVAQHYSSAILKPLALSRPDAPCTKWSDLPRGPEQDATRMLPPFLGTSLPSQPPGYCRSCRLSFRFLCSIDYIFESSFSLRQCVDNLIFQEFRVQERFNTRKSHPHFRLLNALESTV
jgi:hypothetical protein